MSEITCRKRQVVCREGDVGNYMYRVCWGRVGVYKNFGTKAQKLIAELGLGEYFGESGLLEGAARNATVVALENGTVVRKITEEDFIGFMRENPNEVLAILEKMSHHLRSVTRDYMELCREVAESVGEDSTDVDASNDYGFGRNEHLAQVIDDADAGADALS